MEKDLIIFSQQMRTSLSALLDRLNLERLGVIYAEHFHDLIMDSIKQFLAACAAIDAKYNDLSGAPGTPASHIEYGPRNGFCRRYERGAIYYHPSIGAYYVYGAIYEKYLQLGAEAGFLGYPLTDETGAPDGIGRYNNFQGGSIYWKPSTGARETHGTIREKWGSLGGAQSALGYPLTDETGAPDGVGRYSHFEHGSIYWTPSIGAWAVHGLIRDKWASLGWEQSYLGYPTFDENDWTDVNSSVIGRISRFQRGTIALRANGTSAMDLPDTVILSSGPLNTPEPITGWVELMINSAGFFSYKGHLHDSGWVGYHVSVASALNFQAADGGIIVAHEEGHVAGTTEVGGDKRNHNWTQTGFEPRIRDNWDALRTRGMTTTLKANVTVGDVVAAVLTTVPIAFAVGLAMFVVHLFGSGRAQACEGHPSVERDPATGNEIKTWAIPVCLNDPNIPNDNCCKHY